MNHTQSEDHQCIPETATSHPGYPIPEEPTLVPEYATSSSASNRSPRSSVQSLVYSDSSDSELPGTPHTDVLVDETLDQSKISDIIPAPPINPRKRRASTKLISQNSNDVKELLGVGGPGTELIQKTCCGGGCCFLTSLKEHPLSDSFRPVVTPDNDAFRSLRLKLSALALDTELTNTVEPPPQILSFSSLPAAEKNPPFGALQHPPKFVTPHHPYEVFSAKLHHARELTRPGAEKRTYHFDIDVTDYPAEGGDVDFVVGGAIGVCAPNSDSVVDEIFDLLHVPNFVRHRRVLLKTKSGRWPTIWGDDKPRELVTTRRELLTWCADVQSYPPTKGLLRLLAEYTEAENETKILMYLSSAQGQASFCDLRTGPHITLIQLLKAFPSSTPRLDHLLSVLNTLMPRFYSLSQDPQISCTREGLNCRRLIEVAVTVHEMPNWNGRLRTGVGSGYLERLASKLIEAEKSGINPTELDLRVPMFRGLMANPLAREFVTDGPMLLIGAGVGVAPFRGFVQRRLKSANCANKVWVLQGVRDSLLDELYSGEWGVEEDQVKKVVQSRRGQGKYVQEEVRNQADLVWFIINALDGRVFVCGSSKGMGEGVQAALVDVAMDKGNLNKEEAENFWSQKKEGGQYIAVSQGRYLAENVDVR
ncbi:hypothetical protein MMC16_003799 [Acarospora aff. strigata]|nr:hypothetical protein [Acarospora aff. strigata]